MAMLKGVKVVLRDREYTLAPLPLGAVRDVWPQVKKVTSYKESEGLDQLPDILEAAADVVLAAMRAGNEPEMTKEFLIAHVLDYGNWREAFFAALSVSNIKLTERKPGEAPALTRVTTQTGTESSATLPAPSAGGSITSASG
jgi:hypothetical protein